MHGFPDGLHLYDRLVPYLNPPRRVVTFDFLGRGASDQPAGNACAPDLMPGMRRYAVGRHLDRLRPQRGAM